MKNKLKCIRNVLLIVLGITQIGFAQNPFFTDQFTAYPTARVIGDRVYVFPSHDIRCTGEQGHGEDWFCMEDYHVFSSADLMNRTDHGVIVHQEDAAWINSNTFSMWAPDFIYNP